MEIHIGVDVGGTFTDLAVSIPGENHQIRHKLPSTPDRPDVAIIEGIATVLAEHGLDAGNVIRLSHGTTVGTNALIQRKVGKVADYHMSCRMLHFVHQNHRSTDVRIGAFILLEVGSSLWRSRIATAVSAAAPSWTLSRSGE